jgi:2',3'-cyclic-nucleotide 2'-phosphodiesterase (5'-nucleotidase family)
MSATRAIQRLGLVVAVLSSLASTAARAAPEDVVRVMFQADIDGRLATPACGRGGGETANYAATVAAMAARRDRSEAAGEPKPILLLGGNFSAPDVFGRNLVEGDPAGVRLFADIIGRAGYEAAGLGHHELSLGRPHLDRLVGALQAGGLPIVATNLRCDPSRQALCAAMRTDVIIRRSGHDVGVLAVVEPAVMTGIAASHRKGLSVGDPVTAIVDGVKRLRQAGATRVIVMVQGPRGPGSLDAVDSLAMRLPAGTSPDLILGGGVFDADSGQALRLLRRRGAPPIVGSAPEALDVVDVVLGRAATAEPEVTLVRADDAVTDPATRALLQSAAASYCARFGQAVSAGHVRQPLTRDMFVAYVLEVMRRRTGAEITVVNRSFVKGAAFPITPVMGAITLGDLHRALPYSSVLGSARLTGPVVEKTLAPLLDNRRAVIVGLSRKDGNIFVNGRPLDKTRAYRVATVDFVAQGGDALLAAGSFPWQALPGNPDLRAAVEDFLRTKTGIEDDDPTVDPASDFGTPPDRRLLIVGLTDVGIDVLDTSINNGPGYGDAQLTRTAQTSIKGELTAISTLRLPLHEADGRFNLKYGWARNRPGQGAAVAGETVDLITFTGTYSYRGLRAAASRFYVPDPYVRTRIESEVTRPDVTATQPRTYHHLLLTETAGAQFTVATKLKLRSGAGAQKQLLAPGDSGRWRPVVEAGGTLDPIAVATVGDLAVRFEALADYMFVDPTGLREHQLRGAAKLALPLLPLLFLSVGVEMFAVQRQNLGWAASYDTTIGLRVHLDSAYQRL